MIKLITLFILMTSSVHYDLDGAEKLATQVIDAARSNGHDPILFASLIEQESHWDPRARSPMGAYGLAQLHPAYWPPTSYQTPWQQLYQGATVLAMYREKCGGDWRAVAAYRSGSCATVGPATKRVFKLHRVWANRWRQMEKQATLQDGENP